MTFKSTIVALAMFAAINVGISSSAATSIDLKLVYLGSTTASATSVARVAGSNLLLSPTNTPGGDLTTIQAGLSQLDLTNPSIQGQANLKNYFAIYVDYTPNLATDRFLGVAFDVCMPTGMAPVTGNNINDLTTNKFLFWNPIDDNSGLNTWNAAGDWGDFTGDLVGVDFAQTIAANAYLMAVGTFANTVANGDNAGYISGKGTLLGVFALAFTQTNVKGSVSLFCPPGNAGWWTANNQNAYQFDDAALHISPAIQIGVPEPASLTVLALGSAALVIRRKRRQQFGAQ